jgi:hypothetical protein
MTNFRLLSAAAILSTVIATPVLAQTVIQEPGASAFYHPNADSGIESTQSWPREAASVVRGRIGTANAMASLPFRNNGSHASGNREVRKQGAERARAQAKTNDSSARQQAYGMEGRQVAAPPWSAACMTDHGPSECGEPMWIYGSHDALAGYRNAF